MIGGKLDVSQASPVTVTARGERKKPESSLICSFCGKSHAEVRKLIAGPTVYICDECVHHFNAILAQEKREIGRTHTQSGHICAMCAQREDRVRRPVPGNVAVICDGCLNLCNDIVDEATHTDWDRWRVKSGTEPCSFCLRGGEDVGDVLIGYQGARICRDCIELANNVMPQPRE